MRAARVSSGEERGVQGLRGVALEVVGVLAVEVAWVGWDDGGGAFGDGGRGLDFALPVEDCCVNWAIGSYVYGFIVLDSHGSSRIGTNGWLRKY